MNAWVKRRILTLCATDAFATRGDVLSFASRITLAVVLVADILNVAAHLTLDAFGLLPYAVVPAATVGVIITTFLASSLTFSILYIVGLSIHELSISRATFQHLSQTDQLSGLLNRRAFLEAHALHRGDASLVVFDIDRFKALNDSFGHDAGDHAIVSVAAVLTAMFPAPHVVARIGGEEFAALVVGLQAQDRLALAQEALSMVARSPIQLGDQVTSVTVSAGVAEFSTYSGFGPLFAAADKALYLAKAAGRNCLLHDAEISAQIKRDALNGNAIQPLPPIAKMG